MAGLARLNIKKVWGFYIDEKVISVIKAECCQIAASRLMGNRIFQDPATLLLFYAKNNANQSNTDGAREL